LRRTFWHWPALVALFASFLCCASDDFERARFRMARDQIEARGVRNTLALEAMRSTPRHLFVPAPYRSMAYQDSPLPIGSGQTPSTRLQPPPSSVEKPPIRPGSPTRAVDPAFLFSDLAHDHTVTRARQLVARRAPAVCLVALVLLPT
jgi:hypothetical protein